MLNTPPDSSFAFIADGGQKDESGKKTPRSLGYLPSRAGHERKAATIADFELKEGGAVTCQRSGRTAPPSARAATRRTSS
jgi:hypothetical protein